MQKHEIDSDKIKQICEVLRRGTIEPAEQRASEIVSEAEKEAKAIISEAQHQAENILNKAKEKVEQEKTIFQSSLSQAGKQFIEYLRQEIEKQLFNPELAKEINAVTTNPQIIANIIEALINGIEKNGITKDLIALIPKSVSPRAVNQLLTDSIIKKLQNQSVSVGDFEGGVKINLSDKKMTLDMSDEALKELLSQFMRKDFRKFIFNA